MTLMAIHPGRTANQGYVDGQRSAQISQNTLGVERAFSTKRRMPRKASERFSVRVLILHLVDPLQQSFHVQTRTPADVMREAVLSNIAFSKIVDVAILCNRSSRPPVIEVLRLAGDACVSVAEFGHDVVKWTVERVHSKLLQYLHGTSLADSISESTYGPHSMVDYARVLWVSSSDGIM